MLLAPGLPILVATIEAYASLLYAMEEVSSKARSTDGLALVAAAGRGSVVDCEALLGRVPASFQDEATGRSALMAAAGGGHLACVTLLLERGAPWNALDRHGRCAGEYAVESGSQACVDALVDAGVRAQLVFCALGDTTTTDDRSSVTYLRGGVAGDDATLLDDAGDAVMMDWERPLMEASADVLCGSFPHDWCQGRVGSELVVLNVGFGLGIVDSYIRAHRPRRHVICEPHPRVLERMLSEGWFDVAEVRSERWQTALADSAFGPFDAVFFDTYAETWDDMHAFFKALPRLLRKHTGIFSFFNGCCPFNPFFHGVACQFIKVQLEHLGFEVDFVPLEVKPLPRNAWNGVQRKYWLFDSYHLPIVRWKQVRE